MFSVLALSLLSSASGESAADLFPRVPTYGVKDALKYVREHKETAAAFSKSRNLRDVVKPQDMVYQYYRDPACTIPMLLSVEHGNICHVDDHNTDPSMVKMGCRVGEDNMLYHEMFQYDPVDDCSGPPRSGPITFPLHGMQPGVMPGQCFSMGNDMYATVHCSSKDPFRDEFGLHTLDFEMQQNKECHDNGIKTNRPKGHRFIPAGMCVSNTPGQSMMVHPGCGGEGMMTMSMDSTSDHCQNLSPPMASHLDMGCGMRYDDSGNPEGLSKVICVDEMTGKQK